MTTILVTGAAGFIGRNVCTALARCRDVTVVRCDLAQEAELEAMVANADLVFHLAGVNRPQDPKEFTSGNVDLTRRLLAAAERAKRPGVMFASSSYAAGDTPYGISKRQAEQLVFDYGARTGAATYVYRLEHVYGKWCRPHYNSVVATFCHRLARGMEISIDNPGFELELLYIDRVVDEMLELVGGRIAPSSELLHVRPTHRITVAELAAKLRAIAAMRDTLVVPDLADELTHHLHSTFVSYLDVKQLAYPLNMRTDQRGMLAEIVKSKQFGQLFVSRSFEGVTRGNHFHDSKVEKFCVVQGRAIIKFRDIGGSEVTSYEVSGDRIEVVDIPPGYTHSISNAGSDELVVLFWANEMFDPQRPDTYGLPVEPPAK